MRVIQLASAEAVQTQSRVVVTVTSWRPPAALIGDCGLVRVSEQLSMTVGAVEVTLVDPHAESRAEHAAMSRT